jgi:hypothetical protein
VCGAAGIFLGVVSSLELAALVCIVVCETRGRVGVRYDSRTCQRAGGAVEAQSPPVRLWERLCGTLRCGRSPQGARGRTTPSPLRRLPRAPAAHAPLPTPACANTTGCVTCLVVQSLPPVSVGAASVVRGEAWPPFAALLFAWFPQRRGTHLGSGSSVAPTLGRYWKLIERLAFSEPAGCASTVVTLNTSWSKSSCTAGACALGHVESKP